METIDKNKWPRRGHFEFFSPISNPFYSLTFSLDVTNLYTYVKERGLSFYYALCYLTAEAMNSVETFRYKIRGENIVLVDELIPSFTDIRPGSDLFFIVTLPMGGSLDEFCRLAREKSAAQTEFIDQEKEQLDSLIFITCLPWFDMTAMTNERDLNKDDSVPRAGWGKYVEQGGRKMLHYSLELNHRLVDGVHAGEFYKALQALIDRLQ